MRRIIPAVLASIGFLTTFTFRSWHADLWHFSEATDHTIVSAPRRPATVHGMSFPSHLATEPARGHAPPRPAARLATIADAQPFLSGRDREEGHSARVR